jgi:hypothetical protein
MALWYHGFREAAGSSCSHANHVLFLLAAQWSEQPFQQAALETALPLTDNQQHLVIRVKSSRLGKYFFRVTKEKCT